MRANDLSGSVARDLSGCHRFLITEARFTKLWPAISTAVNDTNRFGYALRPIYFAGKGTFLLSVGMRVLVA